MELNTGRSTACQTGFTLVEIMVGLAIGMLLTLVITQVMAVFDAQTRTTTGTADAQTNGGIALYTISRELQMAGYPLLPVTNSPLECTALTINAAGVTGLSPVTITNGVAAAGVSASDSITIRYGSSTQGGIPTQITAMGAPTANDATVGSNFGCSANDVTLITNGAACAMSTATAVSGTTTITLANTASAAVGADIACLGTWNEVTYAVNNGNLERTVGGAVAGAVAGIVNLQAQYGISATANSNQVTQWVDASGATWAAPTVANRNRIKALRIAVVARSAKTEATAVTSACSSTTTAAPTGLCAWDATSLNPQVASPAPSIDLTNNDANWARYRYRVFETVVPLRNVIWSKDTL